MKKNIILILLLSCTYIWCLDYINISYENLYYHGNIPSTENIRIEFDDKGYLANYRSIKYYGNEKKEEKNIIGKLFNTEYELNFDVKNAYSRNPQNFNYKLSFKKTENGWKEFTDGKFSAETNHIFENQKIINKYKSNGKMECLYKQEANIVFLYGNKFESINGFYIKKDLDEESFERVYFEKIDNNHFNIEYHYESISYIYRIETNYYCRNNDLIELLYDLKGFYVDEIILPFIVIPESTNYHSTSYLTEGTTTYEPEHLQEKDGLPWASGKGKGIGEVISIKEFEHENPSELVIMNGYQDKKHPDYYEKNSRIKTLKITNTETKKSKKIIVEDKKEEQRFTVTDLGKGNSYDLEVIEVYAGNKYDDLCIQYLVVE